jgi:hypothetical protein
MNKNNIQMHITGMTILGFLLIGLGIGVFSIFTGGSQFDPSFLKPYQGQSQSSSDIQCGDEVQCATTNY